MQRTAERAVFSNSMRSECREQALDQSGRILRFAGWHAAALALDRAEPDALAFNPTGLGPVSAIAALVMNDGAVERSLRRGSLRYAALKLREVGAPEGAARFLERVSEDDSPGSYVHSGRVSAVPREVSALPVARSDFDEVDDDGAEHTRFFSRYSLSSD